MVNLKNDSKIQLIHESIIIKLDNKPHELTIHRDNYLNTPIVNV